MIRPMGGTSRMAFLALVLAGTSTLVGCDSRAKASDPGVRAESKSKEYESCGASMHCQDDLRCFDNVCRRGARSNVGDYYAARRSPLRHVPPARPGAERA